MPSCGCHVALKTVPDLSPEEMYEIKREFRALAGISHPNLVTLHELIVSDQLCFFTMEMIDGIAILQYVRTPISDSRSEDGNGEATHVDLPRLCAALRQIAHGLGALHGAGTVHRDVKPTNVLVEGTGRLVVLDFGPADTYGSRRATARDGTLDGTPAYMAPELSRGRRAESVDRLVQRRGDDLRGADRPGPHQNMIEPLLERAQVGPAVARRIAGGIASVARDVRHSPARSRSLASAFGAEVLAALDDLEAHYIAPPPFVGRTTE